MNVAIPVSRFGSLLDRHGQQAGSLGTVSIRVRDSQLVGVSDGGR